MSFFDCPKCGRFIPGDKGYCPICKTNIKKATYEKNKPYRSENPWNTSGQKDRPVGDATYIRLNGKGRR